jgi:ElaB/YqjD/DUF883 family membrane-anchored ribosome-binding protein
METADLKSSDVTREKLLQDFKLIIRDTEELLKSTAGDLGEKAKATRERLTSALASAKVNCQRLEERAIEQARATDKLIRDYPYHSVGIALGVGLLFGALLNRK